MEDHGYYYCTEPHCPLDQFSVQQDYRCANLWLVVELPKGTTWAIAAEEPICPHCGATLQHEERATILFTNPFVTFIKKLAA